MHRRLLLAALALPLALGACTRDAADDPTIEVPTAQPSALASTAAPDPTATASGVPADDVDQVVALTVAGGRITGDTGRIAVKAGSRVRITVTADVADEVHLHGYDVKVRTSPGNPVDLEFTADRPGVYTVELEEAKLLLTRLQVS